MLHGVTPERRAVNYKYIYSTLLKDTMSHVLSYVIPVSVYLFIHLVTDVTLDMSFTVYNLYITKHYL